MKHLNKQILISISLILFSNINNAEPTLSFDNAWIPEAPPVSPVLAAYMDITNNSNKAITIQSIHSKEFKKIEIHKTLHESGVAKMQEQKSFSIPAKKTIKLEPGSYHLMLFTPSRKLQSGDISSLVITTEIQQFEISIPVKKSSNTNQHHHHH